MITLGAALLTTFFVQSAAAQTTVQKPSQAYESAQKPVTDWKSAVASGKTPSTPIEPDEQVRKSLEQICPKFDIRDEAGEELYWLAEICESDYDKALAAVQLYLAGSDLAHRADARWLLAGLQLRKTGSWESSWPTIKLIAQQDSIKDWYQKCWAPIDEESDDNLKKSVEWSKEMYAILLARSNSDDHQRAPIALFYALIAGSDLVHRYHLSGDEASAAKVLAEMNELAPTLSNERGAPSELRWANLEMKPAPAISVTAKLGNNTSVSLFQAGRVEVISFFFLACAPCMSELKELNDLQKRNGVRKLFVAGVTTLQANGSSSEPDLEHSLEALRAKRVPNISLQVTSEQTLSTYGIAQFPVVAIIDKSGRVRYIGNAMDFDDDDSAGKLVRQLIRE